MIDISEDNFVLMAARYYDNPQCTTTEEFYDDLNKFKYIKRLLNKYIETGDLRERLIMNHILVLSNVFTPPIATILLFVRLEGYYEYLKPFLLFLNMLPPDKIIVNGNTIYLADINMDDGIIKKLREINAHV